MRWLQVGLFVLIVMLQYRFWFAENGYVDNQQLKATLAEEQQELAGLKARNEYLSARVGDLKSGNDAIEELARQNLGLVKPGEVFVIMSGEGAN